MEKTMRIRTMSRIALLIAIEIVMKMVGLGSVPIGPLYMSFLTVPIAIGAILLGPGVGAVLGFTFGSLSFLDAVSGLGLTGALFTIHPLQTFVLCVGTRTLMGACVGWIARFIRLFHSKLPAYILSALCAPVLNTIFFMGYIVLVFYHTEFIQNLVLSKGATNPWIFVITLVGLQGTIEAIVCAIIGGITSKTCAKLI